MSPADAAPPEVDLGVRTVDVAIACSCHGTSVESLFPEPVVSDSV